MIICDIFESNNNDTYVVVWKRLCTLESFHQSPFMCCQSNPRRWHIQRHGCTNYSDRLLVSILRRMRNYARLVQPAQLAVMVYYLCSQRVLLNGLCTKVPMYFKVYLRAVSRTHADGIFNSMVVLIIPIGYWCHYQEE